MHTIWKKIACAAIGMWISLTAAFAVAADAPGSVPVVMVCEHGSVISLIAATLFNETAKARGLSYQAVSRGVNPDPKVPPKIVDALRGEGIDASGFVPQKISDRDISPASLVIALDAKLPALQHQAAAIQHWDDVPSALADYKAARAALQRHVDALIDELEKSK